MNDEYAGYLFCFFTGKEQSLDDEQIYFAISSDGLHWEDLNGQQPVLRSSIGTKGVRDPFIIRLEKENRYVIIATDLQIAGGTKWEDAIQNGSNKIICWESQDLVNWSLPYYLETRQEDAGCVWAPEAIYDKKEDSYMVFWSSVMKNEAPKKHRVYYCTTKDFHNFSKADLYIERDMDIIDTTIAEIQGKYYRFLKDESKGRVFLERGDELRNGMFTKVNVPVLEKMEGVEGPVFFQLKDGQGWCLLLDRFKEQKGYFPLLSKDLERGEFQEAPDTDYDFGALKKRHGSILKLTKDEWNRLKRCY